MPLHLDNSIVTRPMANAVDDSLTSFGAMPNQLPLSPARV
jgi:hypothetical protein